MRDIHKEFHFRPYEDLTIYSPRAYGLKNNISSECVRYAGCELPFLGVKVGDRLESIIVRIDELFGNVEKLLKDGWSVTTVGNGCSLYRGLNSDGVGELKTINSNNSSIEVTDGETINLEINSSWLQDEIGPIKEVCNTNWQKIDKLTQSCNVLKDSLDKTNTDTKIINEEVDFINKTINYIENKINLLELNQQNLLNKLDKALSRINSSINTLKEDFNNDLNNIKTSIEEIVIEQYSTNEGNADLNNKSISYTLPKGVNGIKSILYNGIMLDNALFDITEGDHKVITIKLGSTVDIIEDDDFVTIIYTIKKEL